MCAFPATEYGTIALSCVSARAVVSARFDGEILEAPRGTAGFGYDPVFYVPPLDKAFAEISAAKKNQYSHRGQAFRKLIIFLACPL